MYAVAVGEMFDAITFYGPFPEFEDAAEWADENAGFISWWVVLLEAV